MAGEPHKRSTFWQELKRRRVVHVIVVYATSAFVIIELVNNVFAPLHLPEWTPGLAIVILSIGFPVTIIFSWFFDLTFKGIVKTGSLDTTSSIKADSPPLMELSTFRNSIAVLPFQDLSPQKDQEYFCDGITEEIIHALARVESLKVIARTSAFAFKNRQVDIRKIGQELNVESLLEGSIRKQGDRIRITAQLINVSDGFHLWSEVYNRDLEDVFAIQDEISLAIVENLKIKLLDKGALENVGRQRVDPGTYDLVLLAQYYQSKGSKQGMNKAIDYYERVIEQSPDNPQAYAGLTSCYTYLGFWDYIPPKTAFQKARVTAMKAIELGPDLPGAHSALGLIFTYSGKEWIASEKSLKKAVQLSPNFANAYIVLSILYIAMGRLDEALIAGTRACELDPLSATSQYVKGFTFLRMGHIEEARRGFFRTLELEPYFAEAQWFLGHTYILEGNIEKGVFEIKRALDQSPESVVILAGLGWTYGFTGQRKEAEEILTRLELRSKNEHIRPYLIAKVYAAIGLNDRAFKCLDQAYTENDPSLVFILGDETLDPLRNDPRFDQLLLKLQLKS